jgi:hypothetical protein
VAGRASEIPGASNHGPRSIPRPSSPIEISRREFFERTIRVTVPVSGFPAAARAAGRSIPWSIALRSR